MMQLPDLSHHVTELASALVSVGAGLIIYQLSFYFLKRWGRKKKRFLPSLLSTRIYYPGLALVILLTVSLAFGLFGGAIGPQTSSIIKHTLQVLGIGATGFLMIRIIEVLNKITLHHYTDKDPLNYSLRKAKTKFQLIERVLNSVIVFGAVAIMLMTFDSIRQVGSTLLASAGVVGIIIGFAAQRSLGTLFAGVQIAISQPIRIDDSVVVEGTFGTVSEITLTYVVINCWDGKRLVVPINYFIEQPFENWTRTSPEVIAKVFIHTDYSLPIEEVRQEFMKWVEAHPLWDKRVRGLHVTGADDQTMEIRLIISAKNSSDSSDLENFMREKLIVHIREKYPWALPKNRVNMEYPPGSGRPV
jgi:small-conductance mechanosensitive channel